MPTTEGENEDTAVLNPNVSNSNRRPAPLKPVPLKPTHLKPARALHPVRKLRIDRRQAALEFERQGRSLATVESLPKPVRKIFELVRWDGRPLMTVEKA